MTDRLEIRHERSHLVPGGTSLVARGSMLFMTGKPRSQQQQFSFRLNEHTAKVFRDKLAKDFVRQQDVIETLVAAWAAGKLDVRELREGLGDSGLI